MNLLDRRMKEMWTEVKELRAFAPMAEKVYVDQLLDEERTDQGLSGWSDSALWKRICGEGRFFITLDVDFADVRRYKPGSHPGILLLRP